MDITMLRILIVDDYPLICAGLVNLIAGQPDMMVAGECPSGRDALGLLERTPVDIVLLDIGNNETEAIESIRLLKSQKPLIRIIAMSLFDVVEQIQGTIAAGADGYIQKKAGGSQIIDAIRFVAGGQVYLNASLISAVFGSYMTPNGKGREHNPVKALSQREYEILRLLARGYIMKEIGRATGLSIKTIDTYKRRSFAKLGLRSRVELLKYAVRQGWLNDDAAAASHNGHVAVAGLSTSA
jgi:DNA-binding NarL/FixJ family response regulator